MPRLYFAHPISDYGSELEQQWLKRLPHFPGGPWEVVNPGLPEHQSGCAGVGMPYFEALVATCDAVALLPFHDGATGAGVWKEVATLRAAKSSAPVWELGRDGLAVTAVGDWPGSRVLLDVEQTRARLRELMPDRRRSKP